MHYKPPRPPAFLPILVLCAIPALAHAAGDPVATAATAADNSWSLVTQYGPLWALALIVQGAGQTFLSRQHWLAQGRTLALISGAVSTLGAVLAWHFNGAPAAGIAVTAVMAIKLAWSPGVAGSAPKSAAGVAGVALAILMLGLAGAGSLTACGTLKADATAIEAGVVTCVKGDASAAKELGLRLGTEALADFLAGRTSAQIWAHVSADAEAAVKVQGLAVASCGFGDLVAELDKLLHPAPAAGVATQGLAANASVDPLAGGRAAIAAFAAAHQITRIDP